MYHIAQCPIPIVSSTSACLRPDVEKVLAALTLCAPLRRADLVIVCRSIVPFINYRRKRKEAVLYSGVRCVFTSIGSRLAVVELTAKRCDIGI